MSTPAWSPQRYVDDGGECPAQDNTLGTEERHSNSVMVAPLSDGDRRGSTWWHRPHPQARKQVRSSCQQLPSILALKSAEEKRRVGAKTAGWVGKLGDGAQETPPGKPQARPEPDPMLKQPGPELRGELRSLIAHPRTSKRQRSKSCRAEFTHGQTYEADGADLLESQGVWNM